MSDQGRHHDEATSDNLISPSMDDEQTGAAAISSVNASGTSVKLYLANLEEAAHTTSVNLMAFLGSGLDEDRQVVQKQILNTLKTCLHNPYGVADGLPDAPAFDQSKTVGPGNWPDPEKDLDFTRTLVGPMLKGQKAPTLKKCMELYQHNIIHEAAEAKAKDNVLGRPKNGAFHLDNDWDGLGYYFQDHEIFLAKISATNIPHGKVGKRADSYAESYFDRIKGSCPKYLRELYKFAEVFEWNGEISEAINPRKAADVAKKAAAAAAVAAAESEDEDEAVAEAEAKKKKDKARAKKIKQPSTKQPSAERVNKQKPKNSKDNLRKTRAAARAAAALSESVVEGDSNEASGDEDVVMLDGEVDQEMAENEETGVDEAGVDEESDEEESVDEDNSGDYEEIGDEEKTSDDEAADGGDQVSDESEMEEDSN